MTLFTCVECGQKISITQAYASTCDQPSSCTHCGTKIYRNNSMESIFTGMLFGVLAIGIAMQIIFGFAPLILMLIATVITGFVLDKLEFCFSPIRRWEADRVISNTSSKVLMGFAFGSIAITWLLINTLN